MSATELALEHAAIAEDLAIQLVGTMCKVAETNMLTFEEKEWLERRIAEVRRTGLGIASIADHLETAIRLQNPPDNPLTPIIS